jgi:hypothetical protein
MRFGGLIGLAVAFFAAADMIGQTAVLHAARPQGVLVVPAEPITLQVAAALPAGVRLNVGGAWRLVEVGRPEMTVPAQLVPAMAAHGSAAEEGARLLAAIPPRTDAKESRRFRLEPAEKGRDLGKGFLFSEVDDKSLKLSDGDLPVLVYNHGLITCERVPQSDGRRTRGCYVHPLWGLQGEVLTDDFPKDHYHHHGIFWTWPHVGIDGKEYDIWADKGIQDRFVRWMCRETGPVAAVLAVENGWFVGRQKVMIERVWICTFKVSGDSRTLDLELTWIPVGSPITLRGAEGKSYGGLTVRFAPRSAKEAVITVPSGRTTADLPDTPLEWADLTTTFGDAPQPSGAAVLVPPNHPDYPPTWLTRHYGPLCVGWPGVRPQTFEPGKPIRLAYRLWIHKTAGDLEQLKQAYLGYTAATRAKWE